MITAGRAFRKSVQSAPALPQPEHFNAIWQTVKMRKGQLILIAGRSGSQKSGFALNLTHYMGLPTLYISGDMSPFEATSRLVEMEVGHTEAEVERWWDDPIEGERYRAVLAESNITFVFGQPITWANIEAELDGWVELHNEYPAIIVIDNLMDVEDCESEDNASLRTAMQNFDSLVRATGSTIMVVHHATDKTDRADINPGKPASRREVKGGVSEKPQLILTVALDPESLEFRVACVKQRSGPCDPSGSTYVRLQAYPEITRFGPLRNVIPHWTAKEA